MKRIRNYLTGLWEDSPFIFIVLILLIMFAIEIPAQNFISSFFSKDIAELIIVCSFLAIFGILGIVMIVRKEAPIIIILIRGLPAIIIGFWFAAFGFGGIIWVIIRHIFSLRVP